MDRDTIISQLHQRVGNDGVATKGLYEVLAAIEAKDDDLERMLCKMIRVLLNPI